MTDVWTPVEICKSRVLIALHIRGQNRFKNERASLVECLGLIECCRTQSRSDLAIELLEIVDEFPLGRLGSIAEQAAVQRRLISEGCTKPLSIEISGERREDLPLLITRGINFATAMLGHANDGFRRCNQAEIDYRFSICQACPEFVNSHCNVCGCPCVEANRLLNKLALASEVCPLGKWK